MMITESHIVPAFHFRVLFAGLSDLTEQDSSFESVSGIHGMAADNNTIFQHQPEKNGATVFQPVVLRRAVLMSGRSALREWALKCLNGNAHDPLREVKIEVLNEEHLPVLVITLKNAYVKTWALGELHAQKSNLLMEEISLGYHTIEIH